MNKTLLELVQDIAVSLGSDEVNSIGDTVEAQSIATIVRNSYEFLVSKLNLPRSKTLFELDASNDPLLPIVMYTPTPVSNIEWLKYDNRDPAVDVTVKYRKCSFWPVADYLDWMHNLDGSDTAVGSYTITKPDGTSLDLLAYTDRHPTKFTTFDDRTLIFDGFDATIDGTLQKTKTLCYGELGQTFQMVDTFQIPLNDHQLVLLLNEAKSQAFIELKQTTNPRSERNARSGLIRSQRDKYRVDHHNPLDDLPNYSRR